MGDQSRQLQELGQDWAAAELRGDTAFLRNVLEDGFVGVGPRGFTLTKEQWLSRHEAGNLKYESFALDEALVRPYGNAAVMVCREIAEGRYEDGDVRHDIHEQFRATLIFVKRRGSWLLAGLHLSPIAGPPVGRQAEDSNEPGQRA